MPHVCRFLLLLLVAIAPSTAWSQAVPPGEEGVLADLLPPEPGRRVCHARTYSAEHLEEHPKQKVTEVTLRIAYRRFEPDQFFPEGQRNYYFAMIARLRGSDEKLTATGECAPFGDRISCGVECDGGGFTIIRRPPDRLLLSLGEGGRVRMTAGCGDEEEDSVDLEAGEDDHAFLLSRTDDATCPAYEDW